MRLHEFEAKALFGQYGIPVPPGEVARDQESAARAARRLGVPVAVKAQVLAGGRGRAGGIRMADGPEDAGAAAAALLGASVRGLVCDAVLVEPRLACAQELYLGVTVDAAAGCPVVMLSRHGGIDVEAAAHQRPEAIARQPVDPLGSFTPADAVRLATAAGLAGGDAEAVAGIVTRLWELFGAEEALIAEINPLALLADGTARALDAVVELDDAALFRHPQWEPLARLDDARARQARQRGMTFVDLGPGQIGLICSGAGLGMATVDLIAAAGTGARAANFLETGGGITRELMADALRLVLSQPGLRAVLINVYGGINPIDQGAEGIAAVLASSCPVPVIAKALGNQQERTWAILRQAGVEVVTDIDSQAAVRTACRLAGQAD